MKAAFPEVPAGGLVAAAGEVSLLMGQDNLSMFPAERRRVGGAALYVSRFGTGFIVSGRPPRARGDGGDGGTETSGQEEHEPREAADCSEPPGRQRVQHATKCKSRQRPQQLPRQSAGKAGRGHARRPCHGKRSTTTI
jgi:hypothetical protein